MQLDRDLRTEEQLYSNSGSSSSYGRPAAYTYSYGGRRADADYGFDDFFRRTAASSRPAQPTARQQGSNSGSGSGRTGAGSGGASRPAAASGGQRWYENSYWESAEADVESDEDEDGYDYGYGGTGFHYRSRY